MTSKQRRKRPSPSGRRPAPSRPALSRSRPSAARSARRRNGTPIGVLAVILAVSAIVTVVVLISSSSGGGANRSAASVTPARGDVVSQHGIHWHPQLAIYINGTKQTIPAGVGIGSKYTKNQWYDSMMQMTDVHTHDSSGTLHWEVMESMAPVTKQHVRLGVFFNIWGKAFNATQIFDHHNGQGGMVTMTVNGKPNTDFDNYLVHDQDRIEIRYQ